MNLSHRSVVILVVRAVISVPLAVTVQAVLFVVRAAVVRPAVIVLAVRAVLAVLAVLAVAQISGGRRLARRRRDNAGARERKHDGGARGSAAPAPRRASAGCECIGAATAPYMFFVSPRARPRVDAPHALRIANCLRREKW